MRRAWPRPAPAQPDNTALQGRLCLGDSGDIAATFLANAYYGAPRLMARADLEALPDEAPLLVFATLAVRL